MLTLIIDATYLCHRAKHSMGELYHQGEATGVIYGFLKEVLFLHKEFNPDRMVFCFDSVVLQRKKLYPQYKANRTEKDYTKEEEKFHKEFKTQMTSLWKIYLPIIGFSNILRANGFEADDMMASVAQDIQSPNKAIIVTADHDLYQCLRSGIMMYNPQTRATMSHKSFFKQYGILPKRWAVVKAMAGCSSDNVEGIEGVGETTAIKYLLNTLPDHHKTYQRIESREGRAIKQRNKPLVKLPFLNTPTTHISPDEVTLAGWDSVCKRLGMKSLRREIW